MANTLSGIQEVLLVETFRLYPVERPRIELDQFEAMRMSLGIYKSDIKKALKDLTTLTLLEDLGEGGWRFTPVGYHLAHTFKCLREMKSLKALADEMENFLHPRVHHKMTKGEMAANHYKISELIPQLLAGEFDHDPNPRDEFWVYALYTDGVKYALTLGCPLKDLREGEFDLRFSHVLLTYPNAEDK